MSRNIIETGMGAIVILVAAVFLVFSYSVSDLRPAQGYDVIAKFNAVDGLTVGSDVRVAGVKVGTVVDERIDQSEKTAGGIIIPDTAKEKPQEGKILAAGPGERDEKGERIPMEVQIGDKVLYAKYSGTEVKMDGKKLLILRESDILAVVEG